MKSKNKLIFIGPLRLGQTPRGGDTMKNNLFLKRFKEVFDKIYVVDTIDWKKKPLTMVKMIWYLMFIRKAKVVISCEQGASRIIDFLYYFRFQKNVFYWVIGSGFPNRIAEGSVLPKHYMFLKRILVQSPKMVQTLQMAGLSNAMYVPNSKPIYDIQIKEHSGKVRFVFVSRIHPDKGIRLIFNCVNRLNFEGYEDKFQVDFYGLIEDCYRDFNSSIDRFSNISYHGLLDLTNIHGYEKLAEYDAMLFPTYYEGEAFPGVFIDAFIASLPVIATDWHFNTDIIQDGKTGFIIPPKDENTLFEKMKRVIGNRNELEPMRLSCKEEARNYDSMNILSKNNLINIGLL
jgi:glycosyltransferase involved in cell wall biosynthesis